MTVNDSIRLAENKGKPIALVGQINGLIEGISDYLHGILAQYGQFPARCFYGESFSALLLSRMGSNYTSSVEILRSCYREKDKEDYSFHWEFNKYAWCTLCRETGDEAAKEFALPLRFRNTPVTNWALLRSCTRYMAETDVGLASQEAMDVLQHYQSRAGLICDQRNVRSFQYHCFSAVLTAEIYTLGKDIFFLDRFRRAADFIERFVLRTGDTLYIGRGQEQSFGYGALACLLALAFRNFEEPRYLAALTRCLTFLKGHQRKDGSFPLVLNGIEEGYPSAASASDTRFPGWYAYNNYFDYLPFLGVFLRKAADALDGVAVSKSPVVLQERSYKDRNFHVSRTMRYEAVLSRPGGGWRGGDGYWTNDLPFPYVVCDGERVTPSYGGEQFGSSLYSPAGIPLPSIERCGRKRLLREGRVWSFFWGNRMIVFSRQGVLVRSFRFLEDEIVVKDRQLGAGKIFARYLFDQIRKLDDLTFEIRGGGLVVFSAPMNVEDSVEYYWGGPLQALVTSMSVTQCTVRLLLGNKL